MRLDPTALHRPDDYAGPEVDEHGASRDTYSVRAIVRAMARRRAAAADKRRDTWSAAEGWAKR